MVVIEINDTTLNLIKSELLKLIPNASVNYGTFGKDTLYILLCFDKKENWPHGYVENSNYCRLSINQNGIIEGFVNSLYKGGTNYENRLKLKFRKSTAKNVSDAILKLSTFIEKVKKELE